MWNKFMSKKTSSGGVGNASRAATSGGGVGLNDADERNNNDAAIGNNAAAPSFLLPTTTMHSSTSTLSAAAIKPRSLRAHTTGPPEEDEYGGILESTKKFTVRRILVSNVNVSPPASIADAPPSSDDEFIHDEDVDDDTMMSDDEDIDNDDEIVNHRGYDAPQISQATQETYEDENMGGGGNGYSDEDDDDDDERGRMVYDPSLPTSNNEHEMDDEEDDYERQEGEEVDYEYDNEATKGNNDGLGTNNNEDFEASLLLGLGASPSAFTTTGAASGNTDDDNNIDKATALCHIINIETDRLLRDRSSSGIAELPNTDPSTLPTSMTSFLDALTEEQRRTRHRYIPSVEGFRKLLKSEIKGDLARARRCRKFPPCSSSGGPTKKQRNMRSTEGDDDDDDNDDLVEVNDDGMEVNDDYDGAADGDAADDNDGTSGGRLVNDHNEEENGDNISPKVVRGNVEGGSSNMGLGAAFVAPTKQARKAATSGALVSLLGGTLFEDAVGSFSSSAGGSFAHRNNEHSRPPPTTVDSITTFHPPRPQESTSAKIRARLRRWETNPSEVETDLMTYRKTVGKTLDELDVARAERRRVEAVAGLVRGHLTSHLAHYRDEAVAIDDKLMGVTARCVKLDGGVNGRSVSTRGGCSGRGMREVITTLMTLGKEAKNGGVSATTRTKEDTSKDWRVLGVGGISIEDDKKTMMKMPLSSGWLLVGDEVIVSSTGDEGIVVNIDGPAMDSISENTTAIEKESVKDSKSDEKKESSMSVVGDSMDIDTSPMKEENKNATTTTEEKEEKKDFTVRPTTISVQLVKSSQVQTYVPAEIEFNSSKMTILAKLSSTALAKRWTSMIETSMATCLDHDFLAMTAYLDAVRTSNPDDEDDGTYSPESVGQCNDNRSLLPFGSGLLAAPADFMAYPSVIPMDSLIDSLDDTARTVIYGINESRVIPTMPSSLIAYESRREEMNVLKGKVMHMRNRLVRQKRLRSLNEQSVLAGKQRAKKMERLLLEMQVDLRTLKGRLQTELTDLGIGNGLMPCVPGESGAVSASSTGDDPVKIEGSSVELRMDQLSGSKEYLSRSEVITGTSDTLNVDDSLADLG